MELNLSKSLSKLKRIKRHQALIKALCTLLTVNLFVMTALFALDNLTAFSAELRFLMLFSFIIGNIVLLIKILKDVIKSRLNDRQAALELEREQKIKDNSLINAVCFQNDSTVPKEIQAMFTSNADRQCSRFKLVGVLNNVTCRRALKVCAIALIIALTYAVVLHKYAHNAALRFVNPWTQLASINFTQFKVFPGNIKIAAGQTLAIKAKATKDGKNVKSLKILLTSSGNSTLYPMHTNNGMYYFDINDISGEMSYKIVSNEDSSMEFKIDIIPKPMFKNFLVKVKAPAYTNLPEQAYELKTTEISAPIGSQITVSGSCEKQDSAIITLGSDTTVKLPCTFVLTKDMTASGNITKNNIIYKDIWRCAFRAKKDQPPVVRFMNRESNIEAAMGQDVPIYINAEDDYGVKAVRVIVSNQGRKGVYKTYNFSGKSPRRLREALMLKLTPEMCSIDTMLEVSLEALDTHSPGHSSQSEVNLTIHVIDLVKQLKEETQQSANADVYKLLFKCIEKQQESRNWLAVKAKKIRRWEIYQLVNRQREVKRNLIAAKRLADKKEKDFADKINKIAEGTAEQLISESKSLVKKRKKKKLAEEVNLIINKQSLLIKEIKSLLGMIAAKEVTENENEKLTKGDEQDKEFFDKMKNVRDKLEDFMTEQKKIIAQTEAIDKKDAEDWTDAEEKLLGDLAARELEWAKFFKAAFNDLSKLQNQDFSNSAMADEFTEMYEELQKAGDALEKKKKIEIATLAENTALDSSTSVAANLDRWLADNKDSIKWNAEESGESPDIPLTDLPAELTDIIGDLIESEDDMGEDTQDSTNSFSYSSDEGMGWGVSDGNIDSMQAKGITGNILPNNNEVGGRSGEGRSGKSSGQFVEKTATGKGGRKTPTRLTQSPFEKGTVEDTSKDAQGGASGGGKQSGVGGEGLIGTTPDQDPNIKERLAGNQGELRQRAEALLRKLGKRQLPTGDLREALNKMALLDKIGKSGKEAEVKALKKDIYLALRNAKTALVLSINAGQEKVKRQKKRNFTVKHSEKEKVPEDYRESVSAYFKALAKEE